MVPQLWSAALTPSMTTSHPWSPPMTSTTIRINKKERSGHNSLSALSDLNSGDGLDRQDLAALVEPAGGTDPVWNVGDRKSTRLNSSHTVISYAVFCLKKKK